MANISLVTHQLATGGDLPLHLGSDAMRAHLTDIQAAGVTHIIDNRTEWSDQQFVAARAPDLHYLHNGQDDIGQRMPDSWFDRGVDFALHALRAPGALVLAHCHMGINVARRWPTRSCSRKAGSPSRRSRPSARPARSPPSVAPGTPCPGGSARPTPRLPRPHASGPRSPGGSMPTRSTWSASSAGSAAPNSSAPDPRPLSTTSTSEHIEPGAAARKPPTLTDAGAVLTGNAHRHPAEAEGWNP
jgi:hypothetical protein